MNEFGTFAHDLLQKIEQLLQKPLLHLNIYLDEFPMWRISLVDTPAAKESLKFCQLHGIVTIGPWTEGSGIYFSNDKKGQLQCLATFAYFFGQERAKSTELQARLARHRMQDKKSRNAPKLVFSLQKRNELDGHKAAGALKDMLLRTAP